MLNEKLMPTRLRREDVVLLMVDVQERLLPSIANHEEVVSNGVRLLKAAEVLFTPTLYTEQYPKGIGATVEPLRESLPSSAVRHEKMAFSCCDEPGFSDKLEALQHFDALQRLEAQQSPVVVVFGIETHICILSTVMDLRRAGREVVVVADACGSRFAGNHTLGLNAARDCGVAVLPTETVIYQMLGLAGTPEFKALFPFLK